MKKATLIVIILLILAFSATAAIDYKISKVNVQKMDVKPAIINNVHVRDLPTIQKIPRLQQRIPFVFSDNDSISFVFVYSGNAVANKNFSLFVNASDDRGLEKIRIMLSDGWHDFMCNNQLSCNNDWVTYELNMGSYTYNAMAIDNAQKVALGSVTINLNSECIDSWVKNNGACLIDDTRFINYNETNNCIVYRNRPLDDGTFASCDYCTPNLFNSTESCMITDSKTINFTDLNSCYSITGLNSDKIPGPITISCDYCTPNLTMQLSNCTTLDNQWKTYTDSNNCFAATNLPSDDVPNDALVSCDYCTPSWYPVNTSCVNSSLTTYYLDSNSCYNITGLISDNNAPMNETNSCLSPGYLQPYVIVPNSSVLVNQSRNFTVTTGVRCVGGSCTNVVAALDPTAKEISPILAKQVKKGYAMAIIVFKDDGLNPDNLIHRFNVKDNQEKLISKLNSDGLNFKVEYKYSAINAMAGEINEKAFNRLVNDENVESVFEEFYGKASVSQGKETLHTKQLNNMQINGRNLTGAGQTVCLIDSGVNYNHQDLGNGGYPNSKIIGGFDFVHNDSDPYDLNGHGTKMAGILAANGPSVVGVAPDAKIVAAVVLNETNWYVGSKAYAAMDWCLNNRLTYNITSVSMSFGDSIQNNLTTCPSYFNAPLRNMNLAGMVLAAASGNEWFNKGIAYPACSPYVIGVGAMDDGRYFGVALNNTITNFTNIGFGMNLLMTPGRGIGTTDRDTGTSSCTGTSCSAPFMAAGGLLLNQYLKEKYNRTINNPKMYALLNSTGRQVPMEDKTRYNGTFTLPYFDEAINRFENPQTKGIVSMNSTAKPFFTRNQNPFNCGNMTNGQTCETTWNVTATGIVGSYEFYTIYSSDNDNQNTTKWVVTII